MTYVARVGAVVARERPDLVGRFQLPSFSTSNPSFLAGAWDLLNLAKANWELLAGHGLAGAQLDSLAAELTRFEAATEKATAGRRDKVGARAEFRRVTSLLTEVVGLLAAA